MANHDNENAQAYSDEVCMVPGCDQAYVALLSNDAIYLSPEYAERWVCRWHKGNPFPDQEGGE